MRESLKIWIGGKKKLEEELASTAKDFDEQIATARGEAKRFSVKEIKGNRYWYRVEGHAKWKYYGPVGKCDPGAEMEKEASELEDKKTAKLKKMKMAVKGAFAGNLLIDARVLQPPEEELVDVKDAFLAVKEAVEVKEKKEDGDFEKEEFEE